MSGIIDKLVNRRLWQGFQVLEGKTPLPEGNRVENLLAMRDGVQTSVEMLAIRPGQTKTVLALMATAATEILPYMLHRGSPDTAAAGAVCAAILLPVALRNAFSAYRTGRDAETFSLIANSYVENERAKDPAATIASRRYAKEWKKKREQDPGSDKPFFLDTPSSKDERPARLRDRLERSLGT
jgi:hypothetical protein